MAAWCALSLERERALTQGAVRELTGSRSPRRSAVITVLDAIFRSAREGEAVRIATRRLQIDGIEVKTGVGTKSATSTAVELTDGSLIPTRTIVATIGNGPNPLVEVLGLDMHWGRIKTDRFMRVPGHDGLWAIGDAAEIPLVEHPAEDLSFPKIISGRIGGGVQPGWGWRRWRQSVELLDVTAHLSVMPSACALDCNTPHKRKEFAAGASR